MMKFEIGENGGNVKLAVSGSCADLAADCAMLIAKIYEEMKKKNEVAAVMFKEHISSIIEDRLPFMTAEELEKMHNSNHKEEQKIKEDTERAFAEMTKSIQNFADMIGAEVKPVMLTREQASKIDEVVEEMKSKDVEETKTSKDRIKVNFKEEDLAEVGDASKPVTD